MITAPVWLLTAFLICKIQCLEVLGFFQLYANRGQCLYFSSFLVAGVWLRGGRRTGGWTERWQIGNFYNKEWGCNTAMFGCSKEKIREKIVINILITQFHLQVCIHVHILRFAAHPIPITATRSPSSRLSPWFLNELNLTALQSVNRHNVWSIEAIMTLMSLTALLLCKRSNPCKVWRACVKSSDCFVSTQTSSILVRICMWKTRSVGESLVASSTPWDQSAARGQAEGAPESTAATSEIREAAAEGGRRTVTRQINYSCHGSSVISS